MADTKKRQSHCVGCGKRLSSITATGDIRWQPSHVDDKGLICDTCFNAKQEARKKKAQTKK